MPEIVGIDVAKYQGAINWQQVKAADKKFAFIRLGWCGWDGGIQSNGGLDSLFHANTAGALAAGLDVGVYVYSYAKTAAAARVAARETLKTIAPYQLAYPVAFDIEDISDSGVRYDKMSRAENSAICSAFLDEIVAAGYYGILYTYKSFAESYLDMAALKQYDMWIAQWASKCTYAGPYGIWQYSNTGKCAGISTEVDLNISYKDYAAIIRAGGLNGFTKPTPTESGNDAELMRLRAENAQMNSTIAKIEAELSAANGKLESIRKIL